MATPVVTNLLTDPKERESWPVLQAYNWVYAHVGRLRDAYDSERPARAADPGRRTDRPRAETPLSGRRTNALSTGTWIGLWFLPTCRAHGSVDNSWRAALCFQTKKTRCGSTRARSQRSSVRREAMIGEMTRRVRPRRSSRRVSRPCPASANRQRGPSSSPRAGGPPLFLPSTVVWPSACTAPWDLVFTVHVRGNTSAAMSIDNRTESTTRTGGTSEISVRYAVEAAKRGESTRLESNGWMSLENAQFYALRLAERDGVSDRVTSYIDDGAVYVGPGNRDDAVRRRTRRTRMRRTPRYWLWLIAVSIAAFVLAMLVRDGLG